ncbi:hypothetical protein G6F56_004826 [Rhizopus delemar]|uniref:Guanine nucleotide-binding protein subunit alpha n=1 Tax=Rhizopus stolonifer TaxID=4846 RepID=A0A367J879_RHIST|nr:hypothetical protein G6F56_004826 [Rhizopus delemar]RCH86162.1 guanine nucleotide-binding protein subunit alpha [Rhizopus stolonifer]
MGCCASIEQDNSAKIHNDKIEEQLRQDMLDAKNEVKLLLLGAGESGKSTILKQMRLIHEGEFRKEEKEAHKEIIFNNILQSILIILEAMRNLGIMLGNAKNQVYVDNIMRCETQTEYSVMPIELSGAIKALWKDRGVQETYKKNNEYQLNDSASYYFDHIDRIGASDYLPTSQDVLYSRVKTTGITETKFTIGNLVYKMFDVGGQRSERKKWIHCFEGVTAVIFLVAISEYDQVLIEDGSVNRMQEALTLFDSICNSRWFDKTSIILFLNKTDLFKQKLPKRSLRDYFSDYSGNLEDFEAACVFFRQMFESLNCSENKQVYTHYTCATETEQVKFVMSAVNDIIIQENLRSNGLI